MQEILVSEEIANLDLTKVAALQQKRTLAFVNHFAITTAQFLNGFLRQCEQKLMHFERKLEKVEATMVLLEARILAALNFFANGSYQRNVGASYLCNMSQPTFSKCLREVTDALNNAQVLARHIKFPVTQREREHIMTEFMEKFGFPGTVGCIDGTHVAILRPTEHEETYFNRKNYHSLNVLILSSIPEVNTIQDETKPEDTTIQSEDRTDDNKSENVDTERTNEETQPKEVTIQPEYEKFVKMVQVGVPLQAVKLKLSLEGLNPTILEQILNK